MATAQCGTRHSMAIHIIFVLVTCMRTRRANIYLHAAARDRRKQGLAQTARFRHVLPYCQGGNPPLNVL